IQEDMQLIQNLQRQQVCLVQQNDDAQLMLAGEIFNVLADGSEQRLSSTIPPSPAAQAAGIFLAHENQVGSASNRIDGANIVAVGSCVRHIRYMVGVGVSLDAIRCSILPVGVTVLAVQRKINR